MSIEEQLEKLDNEVDTVKSRLDGFPGKYYAFSKDRSGYSASNIEKWRNAIKGELERAKEPGYVEKTNTPFEEWDYVIKARKWLQDADEYIKEQELEEERSRLDQIKKEEELKYSLPPRSWILFFFDMPLVDDYLKDYKKKASIGTAVLRTLESNSCELTTDHRDGLPMTYKGTYRKFGNTLTRVYLFNMISEYDQCITLILRLKTTKSVKSEENVFDLAAKGMYLQFDGNRIHSGRLQGQLLGDSVSDSLAYQKKEETWLRIKKSNIYNELVNELGLRSENHISGWEIMLNSNLRRDMSFRYVDFDPPEVLISSDLNVDFGSYNLKAAERDGSKKDRFRTSLYQIVTRVRLLFSNDEGLTHRLCMLNTDSSNFNLRVAYYIHIHTGIEESYEDAILLGRAIEYCKRILILYKPGSIIDERKSFWMDLKTSLHDNLKFQKFDDFEKEQKQIIEAIMTFVNKR